MNKLELSSRLALATGMTNKRSLHIVNLLIDEILAALIKGEEVKMVRFGTFRLRHRKARVGRLPVSNRKVMIPEGTIVSFVPSAKLKKSLLNG